MEKPFDFYRILPEDLTITAGLSSSSAANLLFAIENSKKVSLDRLLLSFNIPTLGPNSIGKIVRLVPSLKGLLSLSDENIPGISNSEKYLLRTMLQFVNAHRGDLNYLLKIGVSVPQEESSGQPEESEIRVDLNQIYATYRMRENDISSVVKSTLETLERVSEERKRLLQLLVGMKSGGTKRSRLIKSINKAQLRDQFLRKQLPEYLEKQRRTA